MLLFCARPSIPPCPFLFWWVRLSSSSIFSIWLYLNVSRCLSSRIGSSSGLLARVAWHPEKLLCAVRVLSVCCLCAVVLSYHIYIYIVIVQSYWIRVNLILKMALVTVLLRWISLPQIGHSLQEAFSYLLWVLTASIVCKMMSIGEPVSSPIWSWHLHLPNLDRYIPRQAGTSSRLPFWSLDIFCFKSQQQLATTPYNFQRLRIDSLTSLTSLTPNWHLLTSTEVQASGVDKLFGTGMTDEGWWLQLQADSATAMACGVHVVSMWCVGNV